MYEVIWGPEGLSRMLAPAPGRGSQRRLFLAENSPCRSRSREGPERREREGHSAWNVVNAEGNVLVKGRGSSPAQPAGLQALEEGPGAPAEQPRPPVWPTCSGWTRGPSNTLATSL